MSRKFTKSAMGLDTRRLSPGGMSHRAIAKIFGISTTRVQQIEATAIRKLTNNPVMRKLAAEYGCLPEESNE
jgi:DNA-directed RNA polymerase sigma subunit (sigma70/sigma32)